MSESLVPGGPRIGVYVCHCGINIASKVRITEVVEHARTLPFVAVAREYKFMCSDPGQDMIQQDIRDGVVDRVVVASCSPLMHEATFRRTLSEAGNNPYLYQMANIREHVSWVTREVGDATEKAKGQVAAAVRRVALHEPLERRNVRVLPDAMVVGAGIAGIQAALTLADSGKKVYLVERQPSIGGHMARFDKTFPTLDCAACILTPKMTQVRSHPNIKLLTYSEVESVEGYVGNFKVKVRTKSRFVDPTKCTGCSQCTTVCPVELPSEFDEGMRSRKAIYRQFPQSVPNVFTIDRKGTPPCQAGCPIHQNAQGYVTLIAQGKFRQALDVILRDNPLPAVCGRICTHPCMINCSRAKTDDALNIPALKRFITDQFDDYKLPKPEFERTERVAIVGSGPAGLMAAYRLRQQGFQVSIYEAEKVPGGVLSAAIPDFRLPREIVARDVQRILDIGVELHLNTRVGVDVSLADLRQKHDAVFLSVGAWQDRKLGLEGEGEPDVLTGMEFLTSLKRGEPLQVGRRIAVIGGGLVAVDCARAARRTGAATTLICLESWDEMFARQTEEGRTEVEHAGEEGVEFLTRRSPKALRFANGKLSDIELREVRRVFDDEGRFAPEYDEEATSYRLIDTVIVAVGQSAGIEAFAAEGLALNSRRAIEADPLTLQTNLEDVFAGGDCVTGPDVVVNAMYAGNKAAVSIQRFLDKRDLRAGRELEAPFKPTFDVDVSGVQMLRQVQVPTLSASRRDATAEVRTGYTAEMAQAEAQRCLDCGVCCDCRLCSTVCEPKAINYNLQDQVQEVEVGAIVLSTGFKTFDARRVARYGYGKYENIFTALEVERMVNASGPTGGELRMRNGEKPKTVAIVHCVGSRDENTNRYCSRVCCMYSLKLAHLAKERAHAEVFNFYIDIRTPGKGYEEFYDKVQSEGVHFIRGRVGEITPKVIEGREQLVVRAEDTLLGKIREIPVDMVILAVGFEPQTDTEDVRRIFNVNCSREGWFLERHVKLGPVSTFTDGIFLAGACQGPKDIPDSVAQAGAAAAEAMALLDRGSVETEPFVTWIDDALCKGCKTCIDVCPFTAIYYDGAKGVAVVNEALCRGCGLCAIECPAHIPQPKHYQDRQILAEMAGALS